MASLYLATFFTNNVSTGFGYPFTFYSTDGATFVLLPNMTAVPTSGGTPGTGTRDPSIMFNATDGLFYMVASSGQNGTAGKFSLYSTPFIGTPWTYLGDVATGVTGGIVAAPEWFVDSGGTVYVVFNGSTTSTTTNYDIYLISPNTAGSWTNTSWGSSTKIIDHAASGMVQPSYDPFIVLNGGTYYLYLHNNSNIGVFTASSLTGTWTNQSNAVVSGSQEGPCLIEIGSTWTLYFDLDAAALPTGFINYATQASWPSTLTFTGTPTPVTVDQTVIQSAYLKQGTVILFPGAWLAAPLRTTSFPKPAVSQGSLSGSTINWVSRLGLARFGMMRFGDSTPPPVGLIIPAGLASGFAAGTPVLGFDQDIGPTGKASDFAAGTPFVNNGIRPVGLGSGFAPGRPTVSLGTITPTGKASDFAAGAPTLNLEQTVAPTGKASDFVAGVPNLIPAQTISTVGKASDFAAGQPTVQGPPQRVAVTGLPSGFAAGSPTINGGTGGIKLWIGGVDFSQYLMLQGVSNPGSDAQTGPQPLQLTSQTIGRWTAIFDLLDVDLVAFPIIDATCKIQENGVTIFSGGIVDVVVDRFDMGAVMQSYHCTAQDWSAICDRRVVNATYLQGADVSSTLADICANCLNGEGISVSGIAPVGTDTLDQNEVFNFVTVTQAFDQICTHQGWTWWVDVNAVLHVVPQPDLGTAPFSLTETSNNFRALSASATLVDYRNTQYVISNLVAVPGVAVQSGTGLNPGDPGYGGPVVTETYTLPQPAAESAGFVVGSLITNFKVLQATSLKVNGVSQPILNDATVGALYNLQKSWWWIPGFPYVYPPNPNNDSPGFPFPPTTSPYPTNGDVVEVSYIPIAANQGLVKQTGTPLTPSTPGAAGTWGSGIFEVATPVKNINLQSDLNAIANALLARSDMVPVQVTFETDIPGAQVGQKVPIDLPPSFLPSTDVFLITQIQANLQTGELEYGSQFKWIITATTGQDLGNSVKWYERLIARTENPLPVQQFKEQSWIISPGGSVTSASAPQNPVILQTGGPLVQATAIAGTAPTDQDLLIDILDNGTSILGAGNQLVIAAGQLTTTTATVFTIPTVAIGDALTVAISYAVKGSNPLPASSVTVTIQWSAPGLPVGQTAPGVYASYITGNLSITTSVLPSGTHGVGYLQSVFASGGTPPYTWTATGLPSGLSISTDGIITGTPASAGTYTVTLNVADSSSPALTGSKGVTLVIA